MKEKISIILFFGIIFLYTWFLLRDSILVADDTCFSFLYGGIKFIKTLYYGSWLMWVMNTLLYVIPHKLNINLQDWALMAAGFFKSGIITIFCIYIFKIFQKNNSNFYGSILFTISMYFLFFILNSKYNFVDFIVNEGFVRFIIPLVLMEIFYYYFYSYIEEEKGKLYESLLMVLAFFAATSSEVAAVMLISTTLAAILLTKEKKCLKFLLILVLGFICLITTKGFNMHISEKMPGLAVDFSALGDFLVMFLKNVIWNYIILYIFIVFLCYKNKHKAFIPISITAGAFSFFLILFFCGKTSYNHDFWLDHIDLYPFLFTSLMLSISFIIKPIEIRKMIETEIYAMVVLLMMTPFYDSSILLKNTLKNIKDFTYARDKIMMFYNYRGEEPILGEFSRFRMFLSVISSKRINPKELKTYHIVEIPDEQEKFIQELINRDYYPIVYGAKGITNWERKWNAIEIFENKGGTFDEIYTGKYKFSNLSKRDFVLKNTKI